MSIHDFHSKLVSGKEEGMLFEALRRLKSIGRPVLAAEQEPGWTHWTEDPEDPGTESGWAVREVSFGLRA